MTKDILDKMDTRRKAKPNTDVYKQLDEEIKHECHAAKERMLTKLVLRAIMNRIRGRTLSEISEVHYGFMPDRGTRNTILVLRRLVEIIIQKQKDVYVCFIDYSKAFDTVKHEPLI